MGSRVRRAEVLSLLLIAVVAEPAAVFGQAAPAKASLALVPAPGKPVRFLETTETATRIDFKGSGRSPALAEGVKEKVVTELSLEVQEAIPGGGYRATLHFGRQVATFLQISGDPTTVRSDERLPADPMIRFSGIPALALGGSELAATLGAGGFVTSVEGCREAVKARAKVLGLSEGEGFLLGATLSPEGVAAAVNAALVATPLPAKELVAGSGWKDEDVVGQVGQLNEIVILRNLRVTRVDDREVSLDGPGTVAARKVKLPKGFDLGDLGPKPVAVKASGVSTTLRISRVDGLPLAVSTEATMTYREGGSEIETVWTWKCSLARVASWPSLSGPK